MAQQTVYDHSLFGGVDSKGIIKQLWGADALKNSILMWLASFQGEILRNPLLGGYLMTLLTKPMTQVKADEIKAEITRGLIEEFTPRLENINIKVTPNYESRYWHIILNGWAPDVKQSVTADERIKNLV